MWYCKGEKQMTIKELYGCEYEKEELYSLQKWYNQMIDKTIPELTPGDVSRMLRQEVLLDLAMTRAIEFLRENPFAGEMYEGEMLAAIARMETSILAPHAEELNAVLRDAAEKIAVHEWYYDGEEEELREIVDAVASALIST